MSDLSQERTPLTPTLEDGAEGLCIALSANRHELGQEGLTLAGCFRLAPDQLPVAEDHPLRHLVVVLISVEDCRQSWTTQLATRQTDSLSSPSSGEGCFALDLMEQLGFLPQPGRYTLIASVWTWTSNPLELELVQPPEKGGT